MNRKKNLPLGFLAKLWAFIHSTAEKERIGMNNDHHKPLKIRKIFFHHKKEDTSMNDDNHMFDLLSTSSIINGFADKKNEREIDKLVVQREIEHKKIRSAVSVWGGPVNEDEALEEKLIEEYKKYSAKFDELFAKDEINFREFAVSLSRLVDNHTDHKISTSFALYQSKKEVMPGVVLSLGKMLKDFVDISLNEIVDLVNDFFKGKNYNFEQYKEKCLSDPEKYHLIFDCWGVIMKIEKDIQKTKDFANETSKEGELEYEGVKYQAVCDSGAIILTDKHNKQIQLDLVGCEVLRSENKKVFTISFIDKKHIFHASEKQCVKWINVIMRNIIVQDEPLKTRFKSFAPMRKNCNAKWYVDGKDYMCDALKAINLAEEEIFITDWSFSPEIYLARDDPDPLQRLDLSLIQAANRGVKVYIMIWREASVFVDILNSKHTANLFKDRENIYITRHTGKSTVFFWSHHQKSLIIDRKLAFVGGIDLTYGRWDHHDHKLFDQSHLRPTWVGKDYYNPAIIPCNNIPEPFNVILNRDLYPREPWHDIQFGGDGDFANDVARNFIERWNHHSREDGKKVPLLVPMPSVTQKKDKHPFPFFSKEDGKYNLQLCRSLAHWSGSHRTERSIYEAYKYFIAEAEHFIYIENQFLISSVSGVENKIVDCLIEKIVSKIKKNEIFRLIIILPMHSEGNWIQDDIVKIIYAWQQKTIRHIYNELEKHTKEVDQYVSINFLMKNEYNPLIDRHFIHPIYVHSKLMIVDDRVALCGSANINDRSMLGDRDSELLMIVEGDHDVTSKMAGKSYKVTTFAHTLRMSLWQEHLGLKDTQVKYIRDPASNEVYNDIWLKRGRRNKNIYAPLYGKRMDPKNVTMRLKEGFPSTFDISSILSLKKSEESTDEIDVDTIELPDDESFVIQDQKIKNAKFQLTKENGNISLMNSFKESQPIGKFVSMQEATTNENEDYENDLLQPNKTYAMPKFVRTTTKNKEIYEDNENNEGRVVTKHIVSKYLGEIDILEIVFPLKVNFKKKMLDFVHHMGDKIEEKVLSFKEKHIKHTNVTDTLSQVKGHLVPFPKKFMTTFSFSNWKQNLPNSIFI